jgi:hypothetical protein
MKNIMTIIALTPLLLVAAPATAAEDTPGGLSLGFEIGPNFVVDNQDVGDSVGIGFSGRAGFQLGAGLVFITPEAKVGFESPGAPDALRILGGARAGLSLPVQPVVFGHLGGLVGDLEGFAWDVGGGLEFNVGSIALGGFVSFNQAEVGGDLFDTPLTDGATWEWVQVGGAVTIVL